MSEKREPREPRYSEMSYAERRAAREKAARAEKSAPKAADTAARQPRQKLGDVSAQGNQQAQSGEQPRTQQDPAARPAGAAAGQPRQKLGGVSAQGNQQAQSGERTRTQQNPASRSAGAAAGQPRQRTGELPAQRNQRTQSGERPRTQQNPASRSAGAAAGQPRQRTGELPAQRNQQVRSGERPRTQQNPASRPAGAAAGQSRQRTGELPAQRNQQARSGERPRAQQNPASRPAGAATGQPRQRTGELPAQRNPQARSGERPRTQRDPASRPAGAAAGQPRQRTDPGSRPRQTAGRSAGPAHGKSGARRAPVIEDRQQNVVRTRARKKTSPLLLALTGLFALIFVVSGGVLLWEMVINPHLTDSNLDEVQSAFEEAGGIVDLPVSIGESGEDLGGREEEYAQRVEAVKKMQTTVNKDICGWLRIEGTNINFPVLSSSPDDEYYLYRDYKGEDSRYGSIFLAGNTPLNGENQLLHGHSMMDGRMFWSLIDFGEAETVKKSPLIRFDTAEEAGDWKILAVIKTNTYPSQGEIFYYDQGVFSSPEQKMQFYYDVMKRSMVDTGVDLNENDRTLMLSTCSYEFDGFRTVVFARKVRENEERLVDLTKITAAANPQMPAVWYGGTPLDYWPENFEDALAAGMTDWYTGALYGNENRPETEENAPPEAVPPEDASPEDGDSNYI